MAFVLDASITACWAFNDEDHPDAALAFAQMRTDEAFVPCLWWFGYWWTGLRTKIQCCSWHGPITSRYTMPLSSPASPTLSADRRFATAYNAALQLAKMTIACKGYRVTGPGHHQTTLEALELVMGAAIQDLAAYFETCGRNSCVTCMRSHGTRLSKLNWLAS